MTRIVFLTALTALVGCKKDDCTDTGEGACDTGAAEEVEAEEEAEEEAPAADSCSFTDEICVEPNEADNNTWCTGLSGTYSADSCGTGFTGTCALPAGGDYGAPATAYYYGDIDGDAACTSSGGTYTAA